MARRPGSSPRHARRSACTVYEGPDATDRLGVDHDAVGASTPDWLVAHTPADATYYLCRPQTLPRQPGPRPFPPRRAGRAAPLRVLRAGGRAGGGAAAGRVIPTVCRRRIVRSAIEWSPGQGSRESGVRVPSVAVPCVVRHDDRRVGPLRQDRARDRPARDRAGGAAIRQHRIVPLLRSGIGRESPYDGGRARNRSRATSG